MNELYGEVKKWIKEKNLVVQERDVEINEEVTGRYKAPGLYILDKHGRQIAELLPMGAWIIGAEGRVDIRGQLDRANLIYLQAGGPHIKTSVSDSSGKLEEGSWPLFKGIGQAGWYWIEDKLRGKARLIDGELFMELLSEVSDYGV